MLVQHFYNYWSKALTFLCRTFFRGFYFRGFLVISKQTEPIHVNKADNSSIAVYLNCQFLLTLSKIIFPLFISLFFLFLHCNILTLLTFKIDE